MNLRECDTQDILLAADAANHSPRVMTTAVSYAVMIDRASAPPDSSPPTESSASPTQTDGDDPMPSPLLRFRRGYLWISDMSRQVRWVRACLGFTLEQS